MPPMSSNQKKADLGGGYLLILDSLHGEKTTKRIR